VHYHFGSKIALLRAIYLRRSASLNAERDLLLTEHMLESNGKPSVAGIIRAFVEPAFRTSPCFAQLSAKIAVDTSPEVRAVATETLGALLPKFIGALIAARPDLRRDEIAWRFLCVIGALMYARVETGFIRRVTGEGVENPDRQGIGILDPEAACEAIVPFLTAGFDAPASCGAQAAPVARFDITPGPRPATRARSRSAGRGRR
jgi:AcrR family transcriptional regulator